ncbi:apolipoprotein L6-like, partial [Ornithorhynchus anatinus]|uniref:apolipoprotein L6-like n=1 Tax=Ornithorhynchus anatinus TaxID=9258 RepID=UPI0007AA7A3A
TFHKNEVNVLFDAILDVKGEISDTLEELDRHEKEVSDRITELNNAADYIDQIHKNCTIAQLVAKSTSVACGILTILGFALVPVTAGGSLILSAAGTGLGTAAAVTSIATDVTEWKSSTAAKESVVSSTNVNGNPLQDVVQALKQRKEQVSSAVRKGVSFIHCVKAIGGAQKSPRLVAYAKRFSTLGNAAQTTSRRGRQVQKAFGATALSMTKGARALGGLMACAGILMDTVAIVRDSQHLKQGAASEAASELRERASSLSQQLVYLGDLSQSLQWVKSLKSVIPPTTERGKNLLTYQTIIAARDTFFELLCTWFRGISLRFKRILGRGFSR